MSTEHDPGREIAGERAERLGAVTTGPIASPYGGKIYVGTAGWTDRTLTAPGVFYPAGQSSAEARLKYYASRFSMVEVDSTFYALQPPVVVQHWVDRTPERFRFCMKAHALLTGHPTEPRRLPADLYHALPAAIGDQPRVYADGLPAEIMSEVRRRFAHSVSPLATAGRLGAVVFQFPPWFGPTRENAEILAATKEGLGDLPLAIEFRNRAWMSDRLRERTLAFLQKHWLAYVMVDAPPGMRSSMPPVVAVTSPFVALVRMHGRRTDTWEKRGVSVADRYRYLYDQGEMAEWVPKVEAAASQVKEPHFQGVHVVFNNCYGNYGTTNALEFLSMLASRDA
jgi:uncharacterized protein YecE (DUF72 family)